MAQEFFINRNATLPKLRMELINDGRHDFNKFHEAIQNADVFFSMYDLNTGVAKILNSPAKVMQREIGGCVDEYVIQYDWKEKDTRKAGSYKGEFKIRFSTPIKNGDKVYPSGDLIVPIYDELSIHILEGSIK